MFKLVTFAAALAAGVSAHGDHSQEAFKEGPHKSLWYNTLPGDGGTQVSDQTLSEALFAAVDFSVGRLDLQWYLHLRSAAVPPMPQEQSRFRYRVHW